MPRIGTDARSPLELDRAAARARMRRSAAQPDARVSAASYFEGGQRPASIGGEQIAPRLQAVRPARAEPLRFRGQAASLGGSPVRHRGERWQSPLETFPQAELEFLPLAGAAASAVPRMAIPEIANRDVSSDDSDCERHLVGCLAKQAVTGAVEPGSRAPSTAWRAASMMREYQRTGMGVGKRIEAKPHPGALERPWQANLQATSLARRNTLAHNRSSIR